MVEENLADFTFERYQYENPIVPNDITPQLPSTCLISEINFTAWFPGCNVEEIACESDLGTETKVMSGIHKFYMSVDLDGGIDTDDDTPLFGWAKISSALSPTLDAILDSNITGQDNFKPYNNYKAGEAPTNTQIQSFNTILRRDGIGDCIVKEGLVEITVLYGSIYQDYEVCFEKECENKFRGNTKSKRFTSCNIEKDREKFFKYDKEIRYKIQELFNDVTKDTDFVCQNNEYQDNFGFAQPCFQHLLDGSSKDDWKTSWSFSWDCISSYSASDKCDNYVPCYDFGAQQNGFAGFNVFG